MIRQVGFQGGRFVYGAAIILGLVGSVATAAQPLLVGSITSAFTENPDLIAPLVLLLVSIFAVDAVTTTWSGVLLGWGSERFIFNLRMGAAKRIVHTSTDSLAAFDRGDVNNRVVEDVPAVPDPWFNIYPQLLSAFITAGLCVTGLFFYSWQLTLVVVGILCLGFIVAAVALQKVETHARLAREGESSFSSLLYETLYNIASIKTKRGHPWVLSLLHQRAEKTLRAGRALVGWNSVLMPAVNIAYQASLVTVILYGGSLVVQGQIELAGLVTFFLFLTYLISPLLTLSLSFGDLKQAKVARNRVEEVINALPPEQEEARTLVQTHAPASDSECVPAIHVSSATCQYPGGDEFPLIDLDVVGTGVHVVRGSNGVGKSSLLQILAGLRRPVAGVFSLNGHDIRILSPSQIRELVLLVPQQRDLFSTTLRENMTMGTSHTEKQIRAAFSQLGADDFLNSLPEGLDTYLGSDGHALSGGQKQLVFLAEMLLDPRQIILLDEPISALDPEYRHSALAAIRRQGTDKLIIMVSHDPIPRCQRYPQSNRGSIHK